MSSASLAPRHPRCRREAAALLHRSVENRPASVRSGGRDLIRVDEWRIWGGVWEVLHAVVAHALGELERRLLLLRGPGHAHEPGRLEVFTRGQRLLECRAVRVHRRAVCYLIDGERARRVRIRELADAVVAHALG